MSEPSRTPHEAALAALLTAADTQTATQAHAAWFEKYARRNSAPELVAAMRPVLDELHDARDVQAILEAKYAEAREAIAAGKVLKLTVDGEVIAVIGGDPLANVHPIFADVLRPVLGR